MNNILVIEDVLTLKVLLYDIDIVTGNVIEELATQRVQKYKISVKLLRYKLHIRYVSDINAVFQSFVVMFVTLSPRNHSVWSEI